MSRWRSKVRSWWAKIGPSHLLPLGRSLRKGFLAFWPNRPKSGSRSKRKASLRQRFSITLRQELQPQQRSLWLARLEIVLLTLGALDAAVGHQWPLRPSPLAGFVAMAALVLMAFTLRRGHGVLARRVLTAVVVVLLPPESLLVGAALGASFAAAQIMDAIIGLRGLATLAVAVHLPPLLARAPRWFALVACGVAVWPVISPWHRALAESLLSAWLMVATLGVIALALVVAQLRRLELGATARGWAVALCFFVLSLGLPLATHGLLAPLAAAFVLASGLGAHLASNLDALAGQRKARLAMNLVVFGAPVALLLALLTGSELMARPLLTVLAFVVGTCLALSYRQLAELSGGGVSPWTRYLFEAQGNAERRHPFEAVRRALTRMQAAPDIERAPILLLFEEGCRFEVDLAGYVRRREASFPPQLLEIALQEPFSTVREEVLYALEVRRSDLRPLLSWLDTDDLRSATIGVAEGEPVCALMLPRGRRRSALSLEELFEAKRLADTLAGHLAIWSERRAHGARELTLAGHIAERDERLQLRQEQLTRRGNAHLAETLRLASRRLPVLVAPKSRLNQEALERSLSRRHGLFVQTVAGNDGLAELASAHAAGPHRHKPLIVVDGAAVLEGSFRDPELSPLLAAQGGSLVLTDVRCVSLATQRFLARALAERRLPKGPPEPLDVHLVLTSRVPAKELLETGELAMELLERLGGTTPLTLAGLEERAEDLRALCFSKLAREGLRARGEPLGITDAAYALLVERSWPGDETQLDALIVTLCRRTEGPVVQPGDVRAALGLAEPSVVTEETQHARRSRSHAAGPRRRRGKPSR